MMKRPVRKTTRAPATLAAPEVEISYAFGFDAAHRFATTPRGHKYSGVHGHSFQCQVTLRGTPRAPHGFVTDLAQVERICLALRKQLDHTLLNEIIDLQTPSLEHLALWIWQRLAKKLPGLARITVRRDSLGQSCSYSGAAVTA
jgi:6-pyruvoyltetrahydropterin/6-carboxytetrahydropterin synthase